MTAGCVLGIDIGGTRIKAGLVDGEGKIVASRAVDTPVDPDSFRQSLLDLIACLGGSPCAAGIGCKGIIDAATTTIASLPGTLHNLEGLVLAELVGPALPAGTPVRADNDARVALAGEVVWGAARGRSDALMLTLGTGVGGAILANGRLLRGASGAAGHLGHVNVDPDGAPCICGSRGCLETVFSAHAIEARAYEIVHRGCQSKLWERFRHAPLSITCRDVFDLAAEGDPLAAYVRDGAIRMLGVALAGMAHALDPEVAILGGQIAEAGDTIFGPVAREVAWRCRVLLRREVPVVPQEVADRSGVVGAAALALHEL